MDIIKKICDLIVTFFKDVGELFARFCEMMMMM